MKSLLTTVAALVLTSGAAFAQCSSAEKASCTSDAVAVTQVSDEKSGDCTAKAECTGDKGAAVTLVSDEKKAGDCAAKAECSDKGAAVTLVSADGKECAVECATACEATAASCEGECPMESFKNSIPAVSFRVADETTPCGEHAMTLAAEHNADVKFVVNNVAYETQGEATEAHTAELASFFSSMTRVKYSVDGECVECPMSAKAACDSGKTVKYQVGPMVFDNAEDAVRASAMAYGMAQQVAMTYEVAGEQTECAAKACDMASVCDSKNVEYVVGDAKTRCLVSAENKLAQLRIEKAIEGLMTAATQS